MATHGNLVIDIITDPASLGDLTGCDVPATVRQYNELLHTALVRAYANEGAIISVVAAYPGHDGKRSVYFSAVDPDADDWQDEIEAITQSVFDLDQDVFNGRYGAWQVIQDAD